MSHYEEVNVRGYDEFCRAVSERKGKDIFAYFSGDKDEQGKSWCPDCVKAEPVVRGVLSHLPEASVFIYCQVGERAYRGWIVLKALVKSKNTNPHSHVRGVRVATRPLQHVAEGVPHSCAWLVRKLKGSVCRLTLKDPNNDFKKTLKLTGVPTLLRYGTPQKLVEDECFKADLVKMMFTED